MQLWLDTAREFGDPVPEPKGRRADVCLTEQCLAVQAASTHVRNPAQCRRNLRNLARPNSSSGGARGRFARRRCAIDRHRRRGRLSQQRRAGEVDLRSARSRRNGVPATVIVKIEPPNEIFRRMGEEFHAFEREIRFYREVAGRVPVRLPKIYYTLCRTARLRHRHGRLGLLHRRAINWWACTNGKCLPRRASWASCKRSSGTTLDCNNCHWMPDTWKLWRHFTDHWPSFVEHCRQWLGPEHMLLGRRVAEHAEWIIEQMSDAPPTIVHCDLREDNLMFGPAGTPEEVLIVDWQLAIRGMGAYDIASLQGGSELSVERADIPSTCCAPGTKRCRRRRERLLLRCSAVSFSRRHSGVLDPAGIFPHRGASPAASPAANRCAKPSPAPLSARRWKSMPPAFYRNDRPPRCDRTVIATGNRLPRSGK